jgi:hypothetical protein
MTAIAAFAQRLFGTGTAFDLPFQPGLEQPPHQPILFIAMGNDKLPGLEIDRRRRECGAGEDLFDVTPGNLFGKIRPGAFSLLHGTNNIHILPFLFYAGLNWERFASC